jgi:epoxide hydrolase
VQTTWPPTQALVEQWSNSYDWRATEAELNSWGQYTTTIDSLDIHFLHIRSPETNALPILMTHGWPGSVLEFRHMIGPLTNPVAHGSDSAQAFDLVIPSLPGFGFSDRPATTGWNLDRTSDAWITLMQRLGYDTWAAQGGDWGSAVTSIIGHKQPAGLVGIHLNLVNFQPTDAERAAATPDENKMLADAQRYMDQYSAYYQLQSTRPQSIAFSLADSPVGFAAWIYALFQDVSDSNGNPETVFSLDEMIDDIMMYWITNTGASSARFYWEAMQEMRTAPTSFDPQPTPTGISMFPGEQVRLSKRWAEPRFSNLVHSNEMAAGGHFAALEQPTAFVEELRTTFASLR